MGGMVIYHLGWGSYNRKKKWGKGKKRLYILCLLLLLIMVLTACGGGTVITPTTVEDPTHGLPECPTPESPNTPSHPLIEVPLDVTLVEGSTVTTNDVRAHVNYANDVLLGRANVRVVAKPIWELNSTTPSGASQTLSQDILGSEITPGPDEPVYDPTKAKHQELFEYNRTVKYSVYYVLGIGSGPFADDGFHEPEYNSILIANSALSQNRTFVHELGHIWGLGHPNTSGGEPHRGEPGTEPPAQHGLPDQEEAIRQNFMTVTQYYEAGTTDEYLISDKQIERIRATLQE
jgi:hypothetical protein